MNSRPILEPLAVIRRFRNHDFTLQDFLASRVEAAPENGFVVFEGQNWTYAETEALVDKAARYLAVRGVRYGDRVGVFSPSHPSTIVLLFALARLGAIMVPTNPDFGVNEASYVFKHAEIGGLVVSPSKLDVAKQAVADLDAPPWLLVNEPTGESDHEIFLTTIETGDAPALAEPRGSADATCLIIYTSGTSGFPKGVMHSQRAVILTGEAFVLRMYLQPSDRLMCVLPLFHINALLYSLCGSIACGGVLILAPRFSASTFWNTVAATRATEVNLVTTAARILVRRPRDEFVAEHQLRKAFIAPLTQEILDTFQKDFGVADIIECYGMTEIPGVLSNPFVAPRKIGSLGIVSPHPDPAIARPTTRIVDDTGRDVRPGESGELAVRTPTIMQGYFRAPEQTSSAFRDGWFRTGDVVYQDQEGYYFYVGRRSDMIRRRGENISGAELDRVITDHPDVVEAAAFPVPSDMGDDDIFVAVVRRPDSKLSAQDVAAWTRHHLNAFKTPRFVAFVETLPRTPTQRIEKYKLRSDKALIDAAIDLESR